MLRTDYIALADTEKLELLTDYYVDYGNYVSQMVGPVDQFIIGRRGTGKTTLLYRSLVECMNSWAPDKNASAKARTLGIYIDLVKCQSLSSNFDSDYAAFEHAFVSELCDAITQELTRSWPRLANQASLIDRVLRRKEIKQADAVNDELTKLAEILRTGLPRFVDRTGPVEKQRKATNSKSNKSSVDATLSHQKALVSGHIGEEKSFSSEESAKSSETVTYRLAVTDLLRSLGRLREAADIPHIILFIDEFSSLDERLQGRFTTLLKKILGNHSGVYVKLCGITDHYTLGSSILLQRDLFELSLDLDSFVERSGSLGSAMSHLESLTKRIIEQRLSAYNAMEPRKLFRSPEEAYELLTRAAMGVPRTLGIVLKQAWSRASTGSQRIGTSDLEFGVRYASKAYMDQMYGAARKSVAIPEHVIEVWESLVDAAMTQAHRSRSGRTESSHFMLLPRHEERLKYLNMFFLVHLLEQGRATKKDSANRSLYCFDYGVALENRLGWNTDKNVIRQQRFAYDDVLTPFDRYYHSQASDKFRCPTCKTTYEAEDLLVAGTALRYCPKDRADLVLVGAADSVGGYTEEEIKILGAIRSAQESDQLLAQQVADDVGCFTQKVAKFGEKMDKEGLIARKKPQGTGRNIYFSSES